MAEQNVLSLAKSAIERTGREIAFQALHVRVVELEQAFMQALGTLYEQGQVLGRGRRLSGVYRPSNEMRLVLLHNQPTVGRSEEQTSVLQSLMRHAHTLFCSNTNI